MQEIPIRSFAVSVVVIRHAATGPEVLLLRRTRSLAGEWCQIAGAIEPGETAWQAALRETREETGLVSNGCTRPISASSSTRRTATPSACCRSSSVSRRRTPRCG